MTAWPSEIMTFWFDEMGPSKWWGGSPELDAEIGERFEELWEEQKAKVADDFLGSPQEALAAIILFDQIPRNMFRRHAMSFATDHLARQIAAKAVDKGFDDGLSEDERTFLYMPFMHSEDIEDQQRSLLLYTAMGDDAKIGFAREHHDIIAEHGRFPHRNEMLGRETRDSEFAAVEHGKNWTG